jgi:hypothetical protein
MPFYRRCFGHYFVGRLTLQATLQPSSGSRLEFSGNGLSDRNFLILLVDKLVSYHDRAVFGGKYEEVIFVHYKPGACIYYGNSHSVSPGQ